MNFPITVKREFDPQILYQEELLKTRSQRYRAIVFLISLAVMAITEAVLFIVGIFDSSYIWLPFITGLSLILCLLVVFVMPKKAKKTYLNFFAQMKAHPDTFTFYRDYIEFQEGAPILPDNIPMENFPKMNDEIMKFPFLAIKFLDLTQNISFKIRAGRGYFFFIIPREAFNDSELCTFTDIAEYLKNFTNIKKK